MGDDKKPGAEYVFLGDTVICDLCNADWTNRQESGGLLAGTYACCPDCAAKVEADVAADPEMEGEVRGRCPKEQSFADWVRFQRKGPGYIVVESFESALRRMAAEAREQKGDMQ
jgi:hypothetical protein